jgi:Uncharacterized protein conserved in bacteria
MSAAMMNNKTFMGFVCFLPRFLCGTAESAVQIDVQPNESQATRMTNSNMSVQPYLFFNGRCEEALEFYRSAVGRRWRCSAVSRTRPNRDGAAWNGKQSDACQLPYRRNNPDGFGRQVRRPTALRRFLAFNCSSGREKAESVFNALADGGKVTMPLEKTFWAPKFGMLEDRFGVGWMVSVQHKP